MGESAYTRIKKSTELEISIEANTEEEDYIADERPTNSLNNYAITLSQDLTMYKGEPDFEYFYEKAYNAVPKNEEVKAKALIVFMFDGDKTAGYKAWETDANILFTSINGVDSKINFDIEFGNMRIGTAKMAEGTPTFTEAEQSALKG